MEVHNRQIQGMAMLSLLALADQPLQQSGCRGHRMTAENFGGLKSRRASHKKQRQAKKKNRR